MRTNLITTFHCYDCGQKLEVDYGKETKTCDPWQEGDPTGAAVCYNEIVIKPCRHCIERETGPAKQLAQAIKGLVG